MNAFAWDLESVPLLASLEVPYPKDDRDPPSNYGAEAAERWYVRDEASWRAARVKECSLHPRKGRVVCISYCDENGPTCDLAKTEAEEGIMLSRFWDRVADSELMITWNGIGFDAPFVVKRSMLLGILPGVDVTRYTRRYSYRPMFDVKMALCDWPTSYKAGEGLDEWAQAFGLSGKTSHGSEVWGMVQRGEWDALTEYAKTDARLTWEVAERVAPFVGIRLPASVAA